ncbi:NAD-dependent succinate-semialdehyde dehydrogenase [Salsuginibacillus kocurii]|uniref:NAD-dependent succinate-semialdehyde dehydrogenase n=1 Tax=Salsuginibacillus kocurii TaxID=427078 RepID=UPI000376C103|nr:NAD-dependent succinate-semialdehyde dehydrogenase [Salsuginibacillus kocurii]
MELNVRNELFINGQWQPAASEETSSVINPATQEVVGHAAYAGAKETEAAITAAHEAFCTWAATPAAERSAYLQAMYQKVVRHADWLAEIMTLEQGKPLEEAKGEVLWGASFLEWYAEETKRVYGETIPSGSADQTFLVKKQPVGVVGAITPWNFPSSMITRKLAPALAAGCTVVLKPAPETPLSAIALYQLFEECELPAGVINLVTGDAEKIGQALMRSENVRKLAFTGSTAVGKKLMSEAASTVKKVSLELGGHAPYIVFDDADIDAAVDGLMMNKFQNNGQTCICANRIFVHETIYDEFVEKFAEQMKTVTVGDGYNDKVHVGPLIHEEAVQKVERHIDDAVNKGATLVYGGKRLNTGAHSNGHFVEPTLLTGVTKEMELYQEETFGPVAPIFSFRDDEEVLQMANATPYGLAAYFYTKDLRRTMKISDSLQYGMVGVNAPALGFAQAPFGGMKQSGMGREGGHHGIEDFVDYQFININY